MRTVRTFNNRQCVLPMGPHCATHNGKLYNDSIHVVENCSGRAWKAPAVVQVTNGTPSILCTKTWGDMPPGLNGKGDFGQTTTSRPRGTAQRHPDRQLAGHRSYGCLRPSIRMPSQSTFPMERDCQLAHDTLELRYWVDCADILFLLAGSKCVRSLASEPLAWPLRRHDTTMQK